MLSEKVPEMQVPADLGIAAPESVNMDRERLGSCRPREITSAGNAVFAVCCIGGSIGGGNSFQVNQSLNAVSENVPWLNQYPWVYGLVMTVLALLATALL